MQASRIGAAITEQVSGCRLANATERARSSLAPREMSKIATGPGGLVDSSASARLFYLRPVTCRDFRRFSAPSAGVVISKGPTRGAWSFQWAPRAVRGHRGGPTWPRRPLAPLGDA